MKKLNLIILFCIVLSTFTQAQIPPQAFNYSAVARNVSGVPIANSTIGIQISILKTSTVGAVQYSENHFVNTDAYGLFNLIIGAGAVQSGSMSTINWSADNYYLKVGMDANGGTNFLTMGITQLLSVPYALHAATADSIIGGVAGFSGNYNDLTNLPILAPIATSGDYNDLTNQPVSISSISSGGDTLYLSNGQTFISSASFSGNYNDLTNQPTNVSSFTNDAGYVTTLNDDDPTNEIQQLSVSATGDTLYLQNGGFIIIPGISSANLPAQFAIVSTVNASSISGSTAISGGSISSNGGSSISSKGVVWSTNSGPSISNNFGITNEGSGISSYTSYISGLLPNTGYYLRAYATNAVGTSYGNEIYFITNNVVGSIFTNPGLGVNFDGYQYPSVVLGNGQEWITENLRTSKYANGDSIPNVSDNVEWSNLTSGAWSYYNNNSQYESSYGKLYNWYAVADSRNVCPNGWHVPSNMEWTILTDYLGGESVAGGKLKEIGTIHWATPNFAGNESGLTLLPSGSRNLYGYFEYIDNNFIGSSGLFWSSTEHTDQYRAWRRHVSNAEIHISPDVNFKTTGFSLRCVKN